jgi:hypothetical protein
LNAYKNNTLLRSSIYQFGARGNRERAVNALQQTLTDLFGKD